MRKSQYEKLTELMPFVKSYFDVKEIEGLTEEEYVSRQCSLKAYSLTQDDLTRPKEDINGKKIKIIAFALAGAFVVGVFLVVSGFIQLITTSGDLGGMNTAYGIALAVAAPLVYRKFIKRYKAKQEEHRQKQENLEKYIAATEEAKKEYQAIVAKKDTAKTELQAKIKELKLNLPLYRMDFLGIVGFLDLLDLARISPDFSLDKYWDEVNEYESKKLASERFRSVYCAKCYRTGFCELEPTMNVIHCKLAKGKVD